MSWKTFEKARWKIHRVAVLGSAFVLLALMVLTVIDAIGRYFFSHPITSGVEISQQLMAYIIFLGLGYVLITGGHVRVEFIIARFPKKFRDGAQILTDIIGFGFCCVLVWGSWMMFWSSLVSQELTLSASNMYYWPSKLAMPIGFFLIGIEFLFYLITHLRESTPRSKNQQKTIVSNTSV